MHGVGSVVCGTVIQGTITAGQRLLLGPNDVGGFMPVVVRECQRLHTPVAEVRAGQNAALALAPEQPQPMAGVFGVCDVALGAPSISLGALGSSALGEDGLSGDAERPSGSESHGDHRVEQEAAADDGDMFSGLWVPDEQQEGDQPGDEEDDEDGFGCALGLMEDVVPRGRGRSQGTTKKEDIPVRHSQAVVQPHHEPLCTAPSSSAHLSSDSPSGKPSTSIAQPHHRDNHRDGAWLHDCEMATSPGAPSFLLSSPHQAGPPRKGAVLLDASLVSASGAPPDAASTSAEGTAGPSSAPSPSLSSGVVMEFEAVVVLLGGRWPARGLLSGRWPPLAVPTASTALLGSSHDECDDDDTGGYSSCWGGSDGEAAASFASSEVGPLQSVPHRLIVGSCPNVVRGKGGDGSGYRLRRDSVSCAGSRGSHAVVVHCGSARQAAQVVWMQELEGGISDQQEGPEAGQQALRVSHVTSRYSAMRATAAILQHGDYVTRGGGRQHPTKTTCSIGTGGSAMDMWSSDSGGESAVIQGPGTGPCGSSTAADMSGCIVKVHFRYLTLPFLFPTLSLPLVLIPSLTTHM